MCFCLENVKAVDLIAIFGLVEEYCRGRMIIPWFNLHTIVWFWSKVHKFCLYMRNLTINVASISFQRLRHCWMPLCDPVICFRGYANQDGNQLQIETLWKYKCGCIVGIRPSIAINNLNITPWRRCQYGSFLLWNKSNGFIFINVGYTLVIRYTK